MRIYRQGDLTSDPIKGARVAVLGYGNQGHAHAKNLRESGVDVLVGVRSGGSGWRRAENDGFRPAGIAQAVEAADFVSLLLPDEVQGAVFHEEIQPALKPGATLVFAHGFTVTFGFVKPAREHDVILVAPKGQGHFLRAQYEKGLGLPCLVGVERDASGIALDKALAYANALGCLRAGALESSFREEAVTDLFGEQVVLCGGVPGLVKAAFDTLVGAGYQPEVAYLECLHELKIIADLMYKNGIAAMRDRISRTAAWGSYSAEERLVTDELKARMQSVLQAIESGEFASGWQQETEAGQGNLAREIVREASHPIEGAGKAVRELMPYLKEDQA